jgi:hypothetical protein
VDLSRRRSSCRQDGAEEPGEITQKRIRRGTFRSVKELVAAIAEHLREYNQAPTRVVWTKDADMILGKIRRCKEALGTPH